MSVKFSYKYIGKNIFGEIYRPIAQVFLKSPKSEVWTESRMIVDTGSDFTILPKYFAEKLNVSFKKDCQKAATVGVGGKQAIYYYKGKIKAKIGDVEREIPLAFFDSDEVPPLLGRQGFMETMDTEFLKTRAVVFKG